MARKDGWRRMFKTIKALVIFPAVMMIMSFHLSNTEEEKAFREAYVHVCELQEKVKLCPHVISKMSKKLALAQDLLEFHRTNLTEERAREIEQEEEYRKAVKEKSFQEACIPFKGGYSDYNKAENKCVTLREGLSNERIEQIEIEIQLSKVKSHKKFIEQRRTSRWFTFEEKAEILAREEKMISDLEIELASVEIALSEKDIKK